MPARSQTRLRVEQRITGGFEARELGSQIVGTIGDVVQPGAALLQEAAHRAVRGRRLQELECSQEAHSNPLSWNDLDGGWVGADQAFPDTGRLGERGNRPSRLLRHLVVDDGVKRRKRQTASARFFPFS
jgi:hypothetical protein